MAEGTAPGPGARIRVVWYWDGWHEVEAVVTRSEDGGERGPAGDIVTGTQAMVEIVEAAP